MRKEYGSFVLTIIESNKVQINQTKIENISYFARHNSQCIPWSEPLTT